MKLSVTLKKNLPNPSATKWWTEGWPRPHLIGKIVIVAEILAIESDGCYGGKVVHLVGGVLHVKVERGREGERALTGFGK
jgi:hypothetical protein